MPNVTFGGDACPERALAVALILRAVSDLHSPNKHTRDDAIAFFTGGGRWRESRLFWFSFLGF